MILIITIIKGDKITMPCAVFPIKKINLNQVEIDDNTSIL